MKIHFKSEFLEGMSHIYYWGGPDSDLLDNARIGRLRVWML